MSRTEMIERLLTVSDVADLFQCSTSWVYKAVERGALPCVRVGAMLRFDPAAVRRYFASAASQGDVQS